MPYKEIDAFSDALVRRADQLVAAPDSTTVDAIVADAADEAKSRMPLPNTLIYQITVAVLGLSVLGVIAAQYFIAMKEGPADIPDGIIAIGSAAIGALAGLLAPTSTS